MSDLIKIARLLEILALAEVHGILFIKSLLNDLNKDTITKEDINNLKNIKSFKEFFPTLDIDNDE